MAQYMTLGKNVSLHCFKEPVKGFLNGDKTNPVPVVAIGELSAIVDANLPQRICQVITDKYKVLMLDDLDTLLRHFKPDHPMAVYKDEKTNKLYITPWNHLDTQDGITVIDELFLDPLVKLGNSYIDLLKTFIRSANVEGLVCLSPKEEVKLGIAGDTDHDLSEGVIYIGVITDDPKIENDEAQILCGAYDLYLNKDEEIIMVWSPYPGDTVYRGISAIIERLFDFSTINPNNQR